MTVRYRSRGPNLKIPNISSCGRLQGISLYELVWHVKRCNIWSFPFVLYNFPFVSYTFHLFCVISICILYFRFVLYNFLFVLYNFYLYSIFFICILYFPFVFYSFSFVFYICHLYCIRKYVKACFGNFAEDKIRETKWCHSWNMYMYIIIYAFQTSCLFSYIIFSCIK
jgi:hypothetical protein